MYTLGVHTRWWRWVFISIAGLCIAWLVWSDRHLLLTAWLIVQATPFEQVGAPDGPTIVVLGDSTAYGTGARRSVDSVAGRLGHASPTATIINSSGNGWTLADVRAAVPAVPPASLVVVMAGGNDILRGRALTDSEADLRAILSALQTHADTVIFFPPGNVGSAPVWSSRRSEELTARTKAFREMAMAVAHETSVGYVDIFLPAEQDPMVQQRWRYLAIDGLHPSAAGYALWFAALDSVLQDSAPAVVD